MKQGRRALQFILHHWWTYVTWKILNWRKSTKNTKVELYSEAMLWKMILCLMQYHWIRMVSITNDSSKSHGYHFQTARLRRTSSWRSICLDPGKNGRCSKLLKIPKSECPDVWIRLPRDKWPKIMVQYGRSSLSSWAKSVRSSFGRTVMGKAIWENPNEVRLGEGFQLGMLICTP